MTFETLIIENTGFVTTVWLSRPDRRNAINLQLATELSACMYHLENDAKTRVVVLKGKGQHFCAGGDLNWMLQSPQLAANEQTGFVLASLFNQIYTFPKPIITVVAGNAMGGAMGLIAGSDFVVAESDATFCFSEVKLGLAPATISPFVVKRIGEFRARQLMTTAMAFTASDAMKYGLVDKVGTSQELDAFVNSICNHIVGNAPEAVKTTKQIINQVTHKEIDQPLSIYTAEMLLMLQEKAEAKEGISAFLEKRKAVWPLAKSNNQLREQAE